MAPKRASTVDESGSGFWARLLVLAVVVLWVSLVCGIWVGHYLMATNKWFATGGTQDYRMFPRQRARLHGRPPLIEASPSAEIESGAATFASPSPLSWPSPSSASSSSSDVSSPPDRPVRTEESSHEIRLHPVRRPPEPSHHASPSASDREPVSPLPIPTVDVPEPIRLPHSHATHHVHRAPGSSAGEGVPAPVPTTVEHTGAAEYTPHRAHDTNPNDASGTGLPAPAPTGR